MLQTTTSLKAAGGSIGHVLRLLWWLREEASTSTSYFLVYCVLLMFVVLQAG
jgi:hypothetical protein